MDNKYLIKSKSFYWLIIALTHLLVNLSITQTGKSQVSIESLVALSECGIMINLDGPRDPSLAPYTSRFYVDDLLVSETINIYPNENNSFTVPQPDFNRFDVEIMDALGQLSPRVEDFQIGEQNPIITEMVVSIPTGHCFDFFGDCLDESGFYTEVLKSNYGCDSTIMLRLSVEGDLTVELNISTTPCNQQLGIISANVIGGFGPYTYLWNNGLTSNIVSNLAAGTYSLTATDQRGQAEIVTDILVGSEPVYHNLGTIENCFGNPIRIGSENYGGNRTGTYTDTLMTSSGCDSIISFDLIVYDLLAEIDQTALSCATAQGTAIIHATGGQAPYTYHWSDQSNSTTNNSRSNLAFGNYSVTIEEAFGCMLVKEVDFSYETPTDTTFATICAASDYILNGESFSQPGTYERVVFNQLGCPTNMVLILDAINTDYTVTTVDADCGTNNGSIDISIRDQRDYRFSWSTGQETANITDLSPGLYTLSLTNGITNCMAVETIEINSLNPPFSIQLLPTNEDCGSGNGQLSAIIEENIGFTYTWRDENNNILGNTSSVDNLSTGTYFVEVQDEIGCIVTKDTFLTSIDFNEVTIDTTICEGACFEVGTECYDEAARYSQTLTNSFGCDSTILLNLQVHQLVVNIDFKHSDCGANNGTAYANIVESQHGGPYSYYWTGENLDQTIQGPVLNNLAPGVYYLRTIDGVTQDGYACTTQDSVVIENLPIDSTFINICEGTCIIIEGQAYCEPGFYRDTLRTTSDCDSIVVITIDKAIFYPADCTVEFENPCSSEVLLEACQPFGTTGYWSALDGGIQFETSENRRTWAYDLLEEENIIIWNLEKGACRLADTAVVFYEGAPIAVTDSFELPYQADTILKVLANDDLYNAPSQIALFVKDSSLRVVNDTLLQYQAPSGFFGVDTLSYMVCNMHCASDISSSRIGVENCDSATITVKVYPFQTENPMPDVLTPNGDGRNDEWIVDELLIHPEKYPENELSIYNRWGGQVFHAKPYYKQGAPNWWKGTNQNGQPLPESTYYYILDLDIGEGKSYKGDILINR